MVFFILLKAGDVAHHDSIEISKVSVVASYNWLDEPQPTILVHGIPPIWSPPSDIPDLRPDTGTRYIDQNQDRMPDSPLEPLMYAIQAHRPDFDFSAVDIITDRRSIRQLYGFINGDKMGFLFGIEVVGDAMIFTRHERRSRETIPTNKLVGYRESFEEAYTKLHPVAQGSTSHHRLITYTLGGLQFLVRSGTDGYCSSVAGKLPDPASNSHTSENVFAKNIKNLSLNKVLPSTPTASPTDKLLVKKGGFDIPQATVFELSTHSAAKPSIIGSKMADLYFAQTSCFVEASFRSSGPRDNLGSRRARFEDINIQDVAQLSERWEKDHQDELRRLIDVLKQMVSGARALGCPAIVNYTGGKYLRIEGVRDHPMPTLPAAKFRSLFLRKEVKDTIEVCEQAEGLSSRNEEGGSWDL